MSWGYFAATVTQGRGKSRQGGGNRGKASSRQRLPGGPVGQVSFLQALLIVSGRLAMVRMPPVREQDVAAHALAVLLEVLQHLVGAVEVFGLNEVHELRDRGSSGAGCQVSPLVHSVEHGSPPGSPCADDPYDMYRQGPLRLNHTKGTLQRRFALVTGL